MSFLEFSNPQNTANGADDRLLRSGGSADTPRYPTALEEKVSLVPGSQLYDFIDPRTRKKYTKFTMDAWIKIENVPAKEYQIVQTVRATRGTHGKQVGCKTITLSGTGSGGSQVLDAFVDGGVCSPGVVRGTYQGGVFRKQKVAQVGKPYFITDEIKLAAKPFGADFDGSDKKGLIPLNDPQEAAINHEKIWFRSYIVAVNYNGTGKDKVLGMIPWGFYQFGTVPHNSNYKLRIQAKTTFDATDKKIILNDYPKYKI